MQETPSTSAIVAKVLMWLAWSFILMTIPLLIIFVGGKPEATNTFDCELNLFFWGILLLPISIALLIRLKCINRLKNPWAQLLLFGFAIFICQNIVAHGIFLIPSYQIVFTLMGTLALLSYLPVWIKLKKNPVSRS